MSKFTPTRRGNPCPACDDEGGRCRHHAEGEIVLCMTFNSSRKGETVANGYKLINLTKDGLWAVLKLDNNEWDEQRKQEWDQNRQRKREQLRQQEERAMARLLPIADRNTQYRHITSELGLNLAHRKELADKRGLTAEEIDFAANQGWLCSWQHGKSIKDASPRLAGVNPQTGNHSLVGGYGLAIAATDGNNLTGFQIKPDNRKDGRAKYYWSSSAGSNKGNGPHLPTGELPVFTWRHPEATQINETWLVEGGLKSLITALKLWLRHGKTDIQVIGAAGANWHGSINAVREALQIQNTDKIVLCPDAGSVENAHIRRNYKAISKVLSDTYKVDFAWWGQTSKDHCDIDELADTTVVTYITPDEFLAIVEEHKPDTSQPAREDYTADWAWQKWLRSRKFTPNITLNQDKFTFGDIPKTGVIIAAKSGLGTGKTEELIREIKSSNAGALIIGYRNNLLFQTIDRASQDNVAIYHLREDDGHSLVADENTHQAFCLDSIHHVDGYFKDRDIYLDETCSVLLHAVNGGTLGDSQARAIKLLTHGLNVCNRVILPDGNLSDMYADFVAKLAPGKQLIKIENQRKIPPHTIRFIEGVNIDGEVKKRDKSALFKAMFDDNHIPWIASDSKELTKIIDKIFKQLGKKGYVINSETVGEDWAKEFLNNPNNFIENNKPDYFIVSPSCESGVSVTHRGHFTVKFTFLCGVQGTNSQHQIMFRLRDDTIPHYVFCPEKSMVKDRSNPNTYSSKVFQQIITERVTQSANFASIDSGNPATVEDIIIKAIQRGDNRWWFFACELGALDNFEMDNLRKCLIHALREAGHDVDTIKWEIDDGFKKKAKEAKEAIQLEHSEEIFAAVEYESVDEANKISKTSQRKDIQRRVEKTRLLDRLPGIKDNDSWGTDFILKCHIKDRDFISKQQRFWLLNNFEVSQKRHESNWFYQATKEDFFIASMKRISHSTIWALKELNILQFLKGEWHKNSPEVIEFIQKAKTPEIALALKTQPKVETISGQERIEFLSSLFAMLGIKFKKQRQTTIDGIRQRIYSVDSEALEDNYRMATLAAVETKLTKWMQEKSQIEWVDTPAAEAVATAEIDPAISALVEELVKAESKSRCDELFLSAGEEKKQQAWELLTADQQTRIWKFYPKPQEESQLLTVDQELVAVSGQDSNSAAIHLVDAAILAREPLCNLELLPTEIKWQRRLGKALVLGADSAKNIYQLVPSQILQTVWQGLAQGVQNSYIQLFEVNNYG